MPNKLSYHLAPDYHQATESGTCVQSARRPIKSQGSRLLRFLRRLFKTSHEPAGVGRRDLWTEEYDDGHRDVASVSKALTVQSCDLKSSSDDDQTDKSSETSRITPQPIIAQSKHGRFCTTAKTNKKPLWKICGGSFSQPGSRRRQLLTACRRKANTRAEAAAATSATTGPFASVQRHSFQKLTLAQLTIPMAPYPPQPFFLTPMRPTVDQGSDSLEGSAGTRAAGEANVVTSVDAGVTPVRQRVVFETMDSPVMLCEVALPLQQPQLEEALVIQDLPSSMLTTSSVAKATSDSRIATIVTQSSCTPMCHTRELQKNLATKSEAPESSTSIVGRVAATVRQFNAMSTPDGRRVSSRSAVLSCKICSAGKDAFSIAIASSAKNERSLSFSELLARFEAFEERRHVTENATATLGRIAAAESS